MRLYIVRMIEDKQGVGLFLADKTDNLLSMIDEVANSDHCEFQLIDIPCALYWPGRVPSLGEMSGDELAQLMSGLEPSDSLIAYFCRGGLSHNWKPVSMLGGFRDASDGDPAPRQRIERPARVTKPDPPSLPDAIYVIECDGHVKIGITAGSVKKRMKVLSTAHHRELKLLATIENVPGELESRLHQRFAEYRVRGEWFKLEGELKAWIEGGCKL